MDFSGGIDYRWSIWQGPGAPHRHPPFRNRIKIRKFEQGQFGANHAFKGREGGHVREKLFIPGEGHLLEADQNFLVERE